MTYADDKVKQRLFQQSRGHSSKINDPIRPVFGTVQDFIHVQLICKFQEDLIKAEWLMLMTKSNRSFFSNQGDVTRRLMIWAGQFSNLSKIAAIFTLSTSFRNIQSKLKELWWWQTFSHCTSMEHCGCHSNQGFHWISMKSLCHKTSLKACYRGEMTEISLQTVEI